MIGLIDIDSKIPNLALMKISSYYKNLGEHVEFVQNGKKYDRIFASAIFTRSRGICLDLRRQYGDKVDIGGTGWVNSRIYRKCSFEEYEPWIKCQIVQ